MNPPPTLRKPKLHFDTAASPSHVTFDDGKKLRRNIPWSVYVEACWNHDETDLIRVLIVSSSAIGSSYCVGTTSGRSSSRLRSRRWFESAL